MTILDVAVFPAVTTQNTNDSNGRHYFKRKRQQRCIFYLNLLSKETSTYSMHTTKNNIDQS